MSLGNERNFPAYLATQTHQTHRVLKRYFATWIKSIPATRAELENTALNRDCSFHPRIKYRAFLSPPDICLLLPPRRRAYKGDLLIVSTSAQTTRLSLFEQLLTLLLAVSSPLFSTPAFLSRRETITSRGNRCR